MKGQERMEASKKIVVGYAVHDIIGNNEQCLTEYDPDVLQRAEDAGLVFVAQDDDGTREVVDPQPATAGETGEEAESLDPAEAFRAALAALKALEATE